MADHAGNALDTYPEGHPQHCSLCGQRAAVRLAADVETLRAALAPFAELAEHEWIRPHLHETDSLYELYWGTARDDTAEIGVGVAEIRKAADAYNETAPKEGA